MLYDLIMNSLDALCDVIEYGPIEAVKINSSFCPQAERDFRRINKEFQESLDSVSVGTVPEAKNTGEASDKKIKAFENLIDDIKLMFDVNACQSELGLIYDYNKLNDYGKLIMKKVCPEVCRGTSMDLGEKYKVLAMFKEKCEQGGYDKCSFVFWALMVLTVDGTDKEEKLSLICDFSRYLNVSDEEMQNIIKLIQAIYS